MERHACATRRNDRWISGAVLLLAIVIAAGPAWACSCASPEPDELVAELGILFRGALISERELPPSADCGDQKCTLEGLFRVEDPLKGTLGQTVRITYFAPNMMCSPSFQVGQTVVVAAYGDAERGYETDGCTQFETTYDAEPSDSEASPVLAAAARHRASLAMLAAAAENEPGNPAPLIAQARFLASTSGALEAIALLDRVLAADPLQRDALLLKAELLSARKHDDQALALAESYLAAHPDDAEAKRRQVLSLIQLGRTGEVAKDWRDFSGLEAENLDFSKRDLGGASFRSGDLREISFAAANLQRANLTGASLRAADLTGAKLNGATLDGADLTNAKLAAADLRGASFKDANLTGTNLAAALYDDATVWPEGFNPAAAGARMQQ